MRKLETSFVNKDSIHSVEYYDGPEAWQDVANLGVKGQFVLLKVSYASSLPHELFDVVIYSTIEKFVYELEMINAAS